MPMDHRAEENGQEGVLTQWIPPSGPLPPLATSPEPQGQLWAICSPHLLLPLVSRGAGPLSCSYDPSESLPEDPFSKHILGCCVENVMPTAALRWRVPKLVRFYILYYVHVLENGAYPIMINIREVMANGTVTL